MDPDEFLERNSRTPVGDFGNQYRVLSIEYGVISVLPTAKALPHLWLSIPSPSSKLSGLPLPASHSPKILHHPNR